MKIQSYLMPRGFRPLGIIFVVVGSILLILKYWFNYKPDYLNLKVFALYSFYIETKTFEVITHQMIADIGGLFLLAGLFLIAFTKEKVESQDLDALRLKAFFLTAYLNIIYLFFSILFFYGFGFVGVLTFFVVYWLAVYLIIFRYLLYRNKLANLSGNI